MKNDDYGFLQGSSAPCPVCGNLIPATLPAGVCPQCGAYLMLSPTIEDYLNDRWREPDVSTVNIHTFLFAMFSCQDDNVDTYDKAIEAMDALGYEKTYEKIKHIWPLEASNENLLIAAKLILDLET